MHPIVTERQKILLFLPEVAAQTIGAKLIGSGYLVDAVQTVMDLQHTLWSADYCLVVTTRHNIDAVRNIRPLAVVNLEIFFHSNPSLETLVAGTKQFDTQAFLARVRALSEPRPQRTGLAAAESIPPVKRGEPRPHRCFHILIPVRRVARR